LNRNYPHPYFAREGVPFLAIALVLAILATVWAFHSCVGIVVAVILWIATIFVAQFFRDPARTIPEGENIVVAPADGRVIKVEPARDPYLDRDALRISIFMNVFNVHSNRAPVDGKVEKIWYHAGTFFNASLDKAAEQNERNAMKITTQKGDVTCEQIAGRVARRILCSAKEGDALKRGQRYGFIRFGSRVDVYLPKTAKAKVTVGQKTRATETVIAEM
jgi:phosphatidylserine decarboxylase